MRVARGFPLTGSSRRVALAFAAATVVACVATSDPLMGSPDWIAQGDQPAANFGQSVATAGDVNGDGYDDVIVGAHRYNNGSQVDEGQAFVFLGSSVGLATTPAWTADADQPFAFLGYSVATAGDVNGDGYDDVIVGAWGYNAGQADEGRALVYLGSDSGLATTPAWTSDGGQEEAFLGHSVATAGDVNGDGYDDVIVGAWYHDDDQADEGRAFVYHGSSTGLQNSAAWTFDGDQVFGRLGNSVAAAGDVNGDGYDDVIVGAFVLDGGKAFVFHGSSSGLAASPAWSGNGGQGQEDAYAVSVATAGDVNGDGYDDIIVGAYGHDNPEDDEGRVFVYRGSASGLATSPTWTVDSNQDGAKLGVSVATAGDVNGDGYDDVIVGAYHYDNGEQDEGQAYVYSGSPSGLRASPSWTADGDQDFANFGISVATAGDVDGDGYDDVIVGANLYDNGEVNEGQAFLFVGPDTGSDPGNNDPGGDPGDPGTDVPANSEWGSVVLALVLLSSGTALLVRRRRILTRPPALLDVRRRVEPDLAGDHDE